MHVANKNLTKMFFFLIFLQAFNGADVKFRTSLTIAKFNSTSFTFRFLSSITVEAIRISSTAVNARMKGRAGDVFTMSAKFSTSRTQVKVTNFTKVKVIIYNTFRATDDYITAFAASLKAVFTYIMSAVKLSH